MLNKRFNQKDIEMFNELHQKQGISLREIAWQYNTTHGVIRRCLVSAGFAYKARKYPLNEEFFEKLDTLEKLYFLG